MKKIKNKKNGKQVCIKASLFDIYYDHEDGYDVKCHVSEDHVENGQVVVTLVYSKLGPGSENSSKGGKARAIKLTPERRKEISQKAIASRWSKQEQL